MAKLTFSGIAQTSVVASQLALAACGQLIELGSQLGQAVHVHADAVVHHGDGGVDYVQFEPVDRIQALVVDAAAELGLRAQGQHGFDCLAFSALRRFIQQHRCQFTWVPRPIFVQQTGHDRHVVKNIRHGQAVLFFYGPGLQGVGVNAAATAECAKGFGKVVVRREAMWITAGNVDGHVEQAPMGIVAAGDVADGVVDGDDGYSPALGICPFANGSGKDRGRVHGLQG